MRISRDPVKRRRLAALGAVAAVALLLGVAVGAGGGGEPEEPLPPTPEERQAAAVEEVDRLSLAQQVGQTLILAFRGRTVPGYVAQALRSGRVAGVILFGENVSSPEQVRALTAGLQRAAGRSALVALDQEGGEVRVLPFAAPELPQPEQDDPAAAAAEAARDLRAVGVNVNLAPVADVVTSSASGFTGRVYTGTPTEVATKVAEAVDAYNRGRVAATVKHFPGIGAAAENTDDVPVEIDEPRTTLDTTDLPPFRAAITADVPLVMAGHALYPALDPRRIASQSPVILRRLLRDELGFRGAVITDSLEAEAVLDRSSVSVAAQRSMAAGADLLLMTGRGSYRIVFRDLLAAARRSPAVRRRVREAAARVLVLKQRLGLRGPRPAGGS